MKANVVKAVAENVMRGGALWVGTKLSQLSTIAV